jgi:hypothetical protein
MTFDIGIRVNITDIKRILKQKQELIWHNIKQVVMNEATTDLVDKIMDGFDRLTSRASQLQEDPTNPANWREEFRDSLHQDIYDTISFEGNRIVFNVGNKEFLGYTEDGTLNDKHDNTPLKWLVYYIEGLAGDWAYISAETYDKIKGAGKYKTEWGRFGQGFMISREDFEAEGWGAIISFESVRHPFSGYAPLDIFTEALDEWDLRPFIQKAITAAVRGEKL